MPFTLFTLSCVMELMVWWWDSGTYAEQDPGPRYSLCWVGCEGCVVRNDWKESF